MSIHVNGVVRRGTAAAACATLALLTFVDPVWAQKPVKPPADEGVLLQWAIALGLMVVVGISAFLNPKRSHRA